MELLTLIEIIATLFGLLSVYLTVKQNIWCWPTGIIMVMLYSYIFGEVKLYSDMGLQVIYIFMQIYGWYFWLHGGKKKSKAKIRTLTHSARVVWAIALVGLTITLGFVMATYTDAALPYFDAFTTIASLMAQWFLGRKVLESWTLWIAVDVVAIGVYFVKELYFTAGLYAVFLGLATWGLIKWLNEKKKTKKQ